MTSDENQICEFLTKLKLLKYKDKFEEEGPMSVKSVGDFSRFLSDPNTLKQVGMTIFEINRFKRLCEETIEVELLSFIFLIKIVFYIYSNRSKVFEVSEF